VLGINFHPTHGSFKKSINFAERSHPRGGFFVEDREQLAEVFCLCIRFIFANLALLFGFIFDRERRRRMGF
jgi:hypothetical protein